MPASSRRGKTLGGCLARLLRFTDSRRRYLSPSQLLWEQDRTRRVGETTFWGRRYLSSLADLAPHEKETWEQLAHSFPSARKIVAKLLVKKVSLTQAQEFLAAAAQEPQEVQESISDYAGYLAHTIAKQPLKQITATTCGAACFSVTELTANPQLVYWLHTGEDRFLEPELETQLGGSQPLSYSARWEQLQKHFFQTIRQHALGPFTWPAAIGSPPWGMKKALAYGHVVFQVKAVDDQNSQEQNSLWAHTVAAVKDGIPVFWYSGGESSLAGVIPAITSLAVAIPRHVVLVVGLDAQEQLLIYEPSLGRIIPFSRSDLSSGAAHPALGNWSRVSVALMPQARSDRKK